MFFTMRVRENSSLVEAVSVFADADPIYPFIIEAQKGNAVMTLYLEANKFEKLVTQGFQFLQERDRKKINETL